MLKMNALKERVHSVRIMSAISPVSVTAIPHVLKKRFSVFFHLNFGNASILARRFSSTIESHTSTQSIFMVGS
jgi:hypothetical protein